MAGMMSSDRESVASPFSDNQGFSVGNPFATLANVNARRSASNSGFTPSNRGFCARFRFRQLASSPSRTRNGTNATLANALSSKPKNSRPARLFKSCTIGSVDSPIVQDLNSRAGREFFGLDDSALARVAFVPFRVREGDEASCLNLNRAQKPRL